MTIRGGTDEYAIAMSTEVSSNTPSGDILYIGATSVKPSWSNQSKIKHQKGRASFSTKEAKKNWKVMIDDCFISRKVTGTYSNAMEELNGIVKYIEDWTDLNHDPVYLFIANRGFDGTYTLMQFRDNLGTDQKYLKGYPTGFSPNLEGQITFVRAKITFEECWV